MPTIIQLTDYTWIMEHKDVVYTVYKYNGEYTITGIEGIFTSLIDVISTLILHY